MIIYCTDSLSEATAAQTEGQRNFQFNVCFFDVSLTLSHSLNYDLIS